MDYTLSFSGKPPLRVRSWGNFPVELMASLAGVKPVVHVWVETQELPELERLCGALGLSQLVFGRPDDPKPGGRLEVLVGKDPRQLKDTSEAWYRPHSNPGRALGYPDCCVRSYDAWFDGAGPQGTPVEDIIRRTWRNSGPGPFPFALNNVFYHYSRRWSAGNDEKRRRIAALNPGLDLNVLNVIPWHPCSYLCAESLRKAGATWSLMQRAAPALAATLKTTLAWPVLFWDWSRFLVLQAARAAPGEWRYTAVRPPFSLVEEETAALVRGGDRLRTAGRGPLEVWKGSRRVGKLPRETLLLDFGV